MNIKNKGIKTNSIIFLLTVLMVFALTNTSYAVVKDVIANNENGDMFEYNIKDLDLSYLLYQMNISDGSALYNHFTSKTATVYFDDVRGYIDLKNVEFEYLLAQLAGESFDLNFYTENQALRVNERTVKSVSEVADIEIEIDGAYVLPEKLIISLSDTLDGLISVSLDENKDVVEIPKAPITQDEEVNVNWEGEVDVTTAGTYELVGVLDVASLDNVADTDLSAKVNIIVNGPLATKQQFLADLDEKVSEKVPTTVADYKRHGDNLRVIFKEETTVAEVKIAAEGLSLALLGVAKPDSVLTINGIEFTLGTANVTAIANALLGGLSATEFLENKETVIADYEAKIHYKNNDNIKLVGNLTFEVEGILPPLATKPEFLADLDDKVADNVPTEVASYKRHGDNLKVSFNDGANLANVKLAAEGLAKSLLDIAEPNSRLVFGEGENKYEFILETVDIAELAKALLGDLTATEFLENKETVVTEYTATVHYKNNPNIKLEGTLTFLVTESHEVKFVDHDDSEIKIQKVADGSDATAPTEPERAGHTFTGWDIGFTNVTTDLTVRAQYAINNYLVTFVDDNGDVLGTQIVDYGSSATTPAYPTKEGYIFRGWDVAFEYVTEDLIVTATYDPTLLGIKEQTLYNVRVIIVDVDKDQISEVKLNGTVLKEGPPEHQYNYHENEDGKVEIRISINEPIVELTITISGVKHFVVFE